MKDDKYKDFSEEELNARHHEKMAKKKAARDKMLANITAEKGLLMVYTGKGKGKTTAAMGLVTRALGNDFKVGVVQFVKGAWPTGEEKILSVQKNCVFKRMGEGFTWDTQDRQKDMAAADRAWQEAVKMINDPAIDLLLLDELNIVLRYNYLEHDVVQKILANKRATQHIVITGRNAPDWLVEMADLVTECTEVKHPFKAGIKAQKGIEY
ncbi:MAG: cob(I)yrinic acid a,c-diamide adenosyltransferase [Hydrotalea sp.]|nr:cob(I)yrinic acid a,c-diamide adenosyltransferase [Hydrotalea sp.]